MAGPLYSREKPTVGMPVVMGFLPFGVVSVENPCLRLTVNDEDKGFESSRFSLETTGGDPDNPLDDNRPLLYDPSYPGTSFTTIRIDGIDYMYGDSCFFTEIPTPGTDSIRSTCVYDSVGVTQKLSLVRNPQTGRSDILEIRYVIKNNDFYSKSVGLREELDTMLGGNDGSPFQVPGTGAVMTETEFLGAAVPDYWLSFDDLANPSVLSQGTLRGGSATPPDRLVFADWESFASTLWDYSIDPTMDVTEDSAVGLYWNPEMLAPGEEVEYVTYYGLSNLTQEFGDMSLSVTAPLTFNIVSNKYSPNPFTVTAFVQNSMNVPINDVSATISLPAGLTLAGDPATQAIGSLDPNAIGSVSWQVLAADQGTEVTLPYSISASTTGVSEQTVPLTITLPAITGLVTQCNDGIDNDGDGLVDMEDTECVSPDDNSESNNVPEFPSAILPAAMIIGILGVVLFIQRTNEN